MAMIDDVIKSLFESALGFGYSGVFLLSFLSNLVIFIPVPYLLLIFLLSSSTEVSLVLLSLISGFGAACGKLVIFTLSRSGRKLVDEKTLRNLEFARIIMERYGFMAVFIVAATPLPDDVFYIPMGMTKFTPIKFFLACLGGKVLLTFIVALGGRYSISWINSVISPESLPGMIATILFIVVSVYATVRIDWEKIFLKYAKKRMEKKRPDD